MFRQYHLRNYNFLLVAAVIALSVIGILVIGSAQKSTQNRQIFGLILGVSVMLVLSLIDYSWLIRFSWIYYLVGCALLAAVLVMGTIVGGATRWLQIGIRFQPSDLMKLVLILFFARFFEKREDRINTLPTILFSLILIGIPLILILREPDLSTAIVTALVFCVIIFSAGLSFKIVGGILLVVVPLGAIFISRILQGSQSLVQGYQRNRIMAWLHPELYPDLARQQQNSIIAIGSGQLFGKGLNNEMVSSVKNGHFIAEPQTDFIFAVVGEELGFAGSALVVLLELTIGLLCIYIATKARDRSGSLIAVGTGSLILFQSFVNIAVTTGLMPNTGIPLPFVSYGVTSLVTFCMEIGIVLNVGLQRRQERDVVTDHPLAHFSDRV